MSAISMLPVAVLLVRLSNGLNYLFRAARSLEEHLG